MADIIALDAVEINISDNVRQRIEIIETTFKKLCNLSCRQIGIDELKRCEPSTDMYGYTYDRLKSIKKCINSYKRNCKNLKKIIDIGVELTSNSFDHIDEHKILVDMQHLYYNVVIARCQMFKKLFKNEKTRLQPQIHKRKFLGIF